MRPEPGIVIGSCRLTDVTDSDTVEVEIRRRVKVRIANCWGPEKRRTKHPTEKDRGLAAQVVAEKCFPVGEMVTLRIDCDGDEDAFDSMTFSRCVGDIWLEDDPEAGGASFGELMNGTGLTFPTKAELERSLDESDRKLARENYEDL